MDRTVYATGIVGFRNFKTEIVSQTTGQKDIQTSLIRTFHPARYSDGTLTLYQFALYQQGQLATPRLPQIYVCLYGVRAHFRLLTEAI